MKTYYELLKDPRWQRKRLEVMQRANFECEDCHKKSEEKKLNLTKLIAHICTTGIDIEEIRGCMVGLSMIHSPKSKFIIDTFELAWGVALVFGIDVGEVIHHAQLQKDHSISASVFTLDNFGKESKETIEHMSRVGGV